MTPEEEEFESGAKDAEAEFDAGLKPGHSEKLTEHGGVKRMEVHAVPKDLSEPEKPEKPGLLERGADFLRDVIANPHTGTGAFSHGAVQGSTLGFADEIGGALDADAKQAEERQKADDIVDTAKRTGTYDPSAAAPAIPQLASYTLKRPGMPDATKVSSGSAAGPLPLSGGRSAQVDAMGGAAGAAEPEEVKFTPLKQAYQQARDSMRERFKTAETEHPGAYMGGELVGALATPLPGLGKAKGLAKVGKYALTGAAAGAAAGLGNSEADLTEGEFGAAAGDTAKGAGGGAAVGGVLGAGAAKLDPLLERMAARRAYKALDPYMKTVQDNLTKHLGRDPSPAEVMREAERLGKRVLEEKIIPEGLIDRFANSETLGTRASAAKEEAGVLKGAVTQHAQDMLTKAGNPKPVSLGQLATNIEAEASKARVDGNQDLARKLDREARNVRQTIVDRASAGFADPAAQDLNEAERFKKMKADEAYDLEPGRRGGATKGAKEAVARFAKQQTENAIEGGLGPQDLDEFKAVKNRYGELKRIAKTAGHGAIRDFRNNTVGIGDKFAAGAAMAHGGPHALPLAVAAGVTHHLANKRGTAALARTLFNAAEHTSPLVTPASSAEPWYRMLNEHADEEE